MKYNILTIPDIHWGVINPYEQLKELEFILDFIKKSYENDIFIDLVVIAGDYFDSKLPLNSREAIFAVQWFDRLYEVCRECLVKKIRMFQGTLDHDNDQLDVFFPYVNREPNDLDYCKIFKITTSEETLPNLHCIYCPDETMYNDDYIETYLNDILEYHNIGFFHGSFDVVYGELLASKPELLEKKNVVFRYEYWEKMINGPLIAGHWHDGKQYNHLFYCGSPLRYKFNEDEPKGIGFVQYDTDANQYFFQKILNPLCAEYLTYEVYTNVYQSNEQFQKVIADITHILNDMKKKDYLQSKLRIMIYIIDDKVENDIFISSLRQHFMKEKNIKIVLKNKLKDKLKKESVQKNKEKQETFDFIYDKSKKPAEIIHGFISKKNPDIDIPFDYIQTKVKEYLKG